jgi:hypothetical protein
MWVPKDASEVEDAVGRGDLEETSSFDGKLDLPTPKRNVDLAIDVAAMTTEGGALLYGVGEDDDGRLTQLEPVSLDGVADRVGQIVATSIAEVPYIEVSEHPCADNPSKGYVSVLVPQSARAPHQVTVGDDRRYYGRGAKGNRRLGEAEVARLYARRLEWEQDRDALLAEGIAHAPFPSSTRLAYLHAYSRPVAPDRGIWNRALAAAGGQQQLRERLREAAVAAGSGGGYAPSLNQATNWRRRGADEWALEAWRGQKENDPGDPSHAVDVRVNIDGRGHLFCGRAAERMSRQGVEDEEGELVIFEAIIAGNFAAFLALIGAVYELGAYHGQVDVGVAVTGLRGGVSSQGRANWGAMLMGLDPYEADVYLRTERVAARELMEPREVAGRMFRHLFEATTGREDFDAFA